MIVNSPIPENLSCKKYAKTGNYKPLGWKDIHLDLCTSGLPSIAEVPYMGFKLFASRSCTYVDAGRTSDKICRFFA